MMKFQSILIALTALAMSLGVSSPRSFQYTLQEVTYQHDLNVTEGVVQIDQYAAYVPPGFNRVPEVPEHLLAAIEEGKRLVSDRRLTKRKCVASNRRQKGWEKCIGDYILAATNRQGQINVIDVYGGKSSQGFSIRCEVDGACDRGVNPSFIVSSPPGWTTVAIRTAVYEIGGTDVVGAVYVPYSSRLNHPELRQAGIEYLRDAVLAAYYELRAKGIESQYIPGRMITDFGTPDHIITLILTEQMWSDKWFEAGTDRERLDMLNRAIVTLGLNRWQSYSYTKSWAGARGIGQIVKKPYRSIRKMYPRVALPEDDVWGRVDHHSAIKTMIAHADAEWWAIKEEAHKQHLLNDLESQRIVLAAGYNANIKTVDNAIHECGDSWRDVSCKTLPKETRLYLVKYEWIYGMLFNPDFRAEVIERIQDSPSTDKVGKN